MLLRSLIRPLRTSTLSARSSFVSSHSHLRLRAMATANTPDFNKPLYAPLAELDPEVKNIIDKETWRQFTGLELIASENLTSTAAMEANGSILTNKYSEGLPNARYYGGNEYIDELEVLCRKRALQAFNLDPAKWGVNVQPYSGSTAKWDLLRDLMQAGANQRLASRHLPPSSNRKTVSWVLASPTGGHLTHGYYTAKKKMTASSIYFQSLPYALAPETQLIDYAGLAAQAKIFKPKLIICGASAYPRDWDYAALKKTAETEGAWLMADIAHTSGLVAAQTLNSPFDYCDVVTTTTHKTLRGPRAGLIFFRKDLKDAADLEKRGGPHNNTIAAIATALLQAAQPSFREYAKQVIANARTLADTLVGHGYKLQTGGTDNHLVLWDLRPLGLTGSKVEKVCDLMGITINKNAVSGDASAQVPGGIRLGTSAITSRNMLEADVKVVADFLHRAVQLSLLLQKEAGTKMLKDFVRELRAEVIEFATKWPLPGVDVSTLKKPAGIHE
ncbi:Serine hydroxymethyltransferase [Mycena sanguinolenta]|uniref:Serine hydroxymethyltransferase n=1 Tax=Mycena sanguinolenta TaxID=230812 RepID=A0A8H7CF95_9AGAR|nr:Serine hydroxymethyltransferase [Mycena sanguinolenta]